MPIKITIDSGPGPVDYTQYVVSSSIKVEDNINTPAVITFSVSNTNNAFSAPTINSYVRVFSTTLNKTLFSGFVSSVPAPEFLGAGSNVPKFGFQRLVWVVNATSDEYLLNVKSVPFIPAFINQTQGQILTSIASALAPGFFDTSNIAAGDLIPYYVYDPSKKWSDVAKELGDQSRMHHWSLDKKLFFQPLGDAPLGVAYDETQPQTTFYPAVLQTNVSPIQPLNDAIVIGDVEPQNSWDNYFIGDGITNGFDTKHKTFRGASSILLKDDWTENAFQTNTWQKVDPTSTMALVGSLNVTNGASAAFGLGDNYLEALNGLELGGALDLQHGEFSFNDTCTGIIGGVYSAAVPVLSNCLAGYNISPSAYQQTLADNFARTDVSPLTGAWATQPGTTNLQIVGGAVEGTANGGGSRNAAYYNTALPNNQYAEVVILGASNTSAFVGPGVRMGNGPTENGYYCLVQGPLGATAQVYIQKVVAGVNTNLAHTTTTVNAGDVARLEIVGTKLTLKISGQTILAVNDGSLGSGFAGMFLATQSVALTTGTVGNFAAGSIGTTVVTVTASGASGLQIQPILNGQLVGTPVPVKANHHYFLRTLLTSRTFARFNKAYRTLAGAVFGNLPVSATVDVTFIIYDIDLAAFNLLPGGVVPIFVPPPVPSKQFFTNNTFPSFGVYSLLNQQQLNLNVSSTILVQPPQGTLQVASLYGPTGTQLPISPIAPNLLAFPQDFENAVWVKNTATVNPDSVTAPDGTLSADAVTPTGGAVDAYVGQPTPSLSVGQTYTFSVWLRVPAGTKTIGLLFRDAATTDVSQNFNLTTTWQRFSLTRTIVNGGVGGVYVGALGSWTAGEVDIWGARLEVGAIVGTSSNGGQVVPYALGFGYGEQVATINTGTDFDVLQFYTDTIPAVGARIRLQSWEPGKSMARVQNPVDIATEAKIVGDDGVRTFIYTNLQPLPRTSVDCEAAASALLSDYVKTQWDGQYEAHNHFWDSTKDYPKTGRFFAVNTTQRGISGQQFLVRKVTTTVLELYDEVLDFTIEYGQDTYIEKLLTKFVSRDQNVLTPKDSANPPNLQFIQNIGQTYAPNLDKAQATSIDSSFVQIDLGVAPVTGCEVRTVDSGWGSPKNRVGLFTTQTFQLNRTNLNQIWYMRQINGAQISRVSKVIHVGYPLLPAAPIITQVDTSDILHPAIYFGFNGDIRNIYGIEIRDADNATVLLQRAVFSTSELLYVFDNSLRKTRSQTFFVYFFNLLWGYGPVFQFTLNLPAPVVIPSVDELSITLLMTVQASGGRADNIEWQITEDPNFVVPSATGSLAVSGISGQFLNFVHALTNDDFLQQRYFQTRGRDKIGYGNWAQTSHIYTPQGIITFDGTNNVITVPVPPTPNTDPVIPAALQPHKSDLIDEGWRQYGRNLPRIYR